MYEYDHTGNIVPLNPPHPGGAIEMELEERGMTVAQLAEATGLPVEKLQALVDGKADFTTAESIPLQHYFGYSWDHFMGLQKLYDEHIVIAAKRKQWLKEQKRSKLLFWRKHRNTAAAL